jgi:hypothetical protein
MNFNSKNQLNQRKKVHKILRDKLATDFSHNKILGYKERQAPLLPQSETPRQRVGFIKRGRYPLGKF